jgi:hypothetical protein
MKKLFRYIEPIWMGVDNRVSLRRVLAILFSIDLIRNTSHVIYHWEVGKSYADIAMLLGIEAGIVAALLSLTTYSNSLLTKTNDQQLN